MNADEVQQLREQYEKWLSEHFEPDRTQSGRPRVRGGITIYEDVHQIEHLLGESTFEATELFRRGERPAYRVLIAIQEIVELWDEQAIRNLRRDQSLARRLKSAVAYHNRHGRAPDGGEIGPWARRSLETMNERYGVEGKPGREAGDLWSSIFGQPKANQVRANKVRDSKGQRGSEVSSEAQPASNHNTEERRQACKT